MEDGKLVAEGKFASAELNPFAAQVAASSPQTTLTFYVQSAEESQRRAVAKLEEVMMPTCAPVAPQMRPSAEQA